MLNSGTEKWRSSGLWPGVLDQRNPGGKQPVVVGMTRALEFRPVVERDSEEVSVLWGRELVASPAGEADTLLHPVAGS